MDRKMKMVAGIALVLAVLSTAIIAAPALADANGTNNGDQLMDQERLRTRDMDCDGDRLQTRERDQLRDQDCRCDGDPLGTQTQERQRTQNQTCNTELNGYCSGGQYGAGIGANNEGNLEQHRSQQRRGNQGL
jgi:hypothetical protein